MSSQHKKVKAKTYLKSLMKKAHNAINLAIGNSEAYSHEDAEGDLNFDPTIMMKINVTFDKHFLPREKVVKLNVRGTRFFNDIKRDIREINGIFIVYPHHYEMQFDVRRDEFEKRLLEELNSEYQLTLQKIHFFSEEEICAIYQRNGIAHIRNPYNLEEGELLLIAGGFANFDTDGIPLSSVHADIAKYKRIAIHRRNTDKLTQDKELYKAIMGEDTPIEQERETVSQSYDSQYFGKLSDKSGAYFYVGGEWYHNLFIPEMYQQQTPRFFSFRIADDGRNLKFFSDQKERGIDIRSNAETITNPDSEKIIYMINPEYIKDTAIKAFTLTITYDIKEEIQPIIKEVPLEVPVPKDNIITLDELDRIPEPGEIETRPVPIDIIKPIPQNQTEVIPAEDLKDTRIEMPTPIPAMAEKTTTETSTESFEDIAETKEEIILEHKETRPFLESEMILLPRPRANDVASYMMTIGDEKKNIKFYASSLDKEISILAPDREEEVYKKTIGQDVDYSKKIGRIEYSVSNTFISRLNDKELQLYFGWELKSNAHDRLYLDSDFYIFGRGPLDNMGMRSTGNIYNQLVSLNKGEDDFWRIGTSRDHAFLLRSPKGHTLYNISLSYPLYLVKAAELNNAKIEPIRLEPISGSDKAEQVAGLLEHTKDQLADHQQPPGVSNLTQMLLNRLTSVELENNDLVIIGNRVFKYGVPLKMESLLSDRVIKSILRKVEINRSILRKQ